MENCNLAYIDFIDQRLTKKDYLAPKLPMTLLMSGNGTLNTPYKVSFQNDILAKSLLFLNRDHLIKVLPLFFYNLNALLENLSFYKFNRQTMTDLNNVIELLEKANENIFNPIDTKITLYLFENSYTYTDGGSTLQRRRSLPLEFQTLWQTPTMYKNVIRFIQTKLFTKKSEIRFGFVIESLKIVQHQTLTDRMSNALKVGLNRVDGEKHGDLISKL